MDCLLFFDILTSSTSTANRTAENPATQLYAILGNMMEMNVVMTSCTRAQNTLNTINMLRRYIDPNLCSTELPTELRNITLNITCIQLVRINAPIFVTPHRPQVGHRWGLLGICKSHLTNSPLLGTILCCKSSSFCIGIPKTMKILGQMPQP